MLKSQKKGEKLYVYLCGDLDHCAASALRPEIEALIRDPGIRELHLDFSGVSFIDSSGIGMIIGRYKSMVNRGGHVSAGALAQPVERLFRLAGLHRIIPIISTEE